MKMNMGGSATPEGFSDGGADEFAKRMAALLGSQENEEAGEIVEQQGTSIFPKPTKQAAPFAFRGKLNAATNHPKKREELKAATLNAVFFGRVQELFAFTEEQTEGEQPKPSPIVSELRNDFSQPIALRVEWPEGFAIEDGGDSLTIHARAGTLELDGATVSRLFQFADAVGFWERSPAFWADGVGEWSKAAYFEAFHLSRPVIPEISLSAKDFQKRQWWLGVLSQQTEEAKVYKGSQRGAEAKGKADYMAAVMQEATKPPPAVRQN